MPVDRPGDQGEELGPRRAGGQVAERGVGLEHLALGRPDPADLEEVVHHGDELEAALVGGAGHRGQVGAEPRRAVRRGEVRDLESDFHA